MVQEPKAVLGGEAFLQFFDDGVAYFQCSATGTANQVIMVLVPVMVLITHDAVAEIDLPGETCLAQEFQDPVNRRLTDGPVPFLDDVIKFFRRCVFFALQELI